MRKFTRRRFPARRARKPTDSRQFNLCGLDMTLVGGQEGTENNCATPAAFWTTIAYPVTEGSASNQVAVSRGLVFSSARFKYAYTLRDDPPGTTAAFFNSLFIRSALVLSPQSGGTPFQDPVTGNLPLLFDTNGDLPNGLRILWRSLDRLTNNYVNGNGLPAVNVLNHPLPLERFNGRVRIHEGQGLYWVSEVVSGNPALNAHMVCDLTMAYRLGNL